MRNANNEKENPNPFIFSTGKKNAKNDEKNESLNTNTKLKSNKKLFPLLMDSTMRNNKVNLLNKIKKKAINNEEEGILVNENGHNNILLRTILNKKLGKSKNIGIKSFPLIKSMDKNKNESDIKLSFENTKIDNNNNTTNNKRKLVLFKDSINNLSKSKSQIKLKICDTINTKIKNLKHNINNDYNKIKTENNFGSLQIKRKGVGNSQ